MGVKNNTVNIRGPFGAGGYVSGKYVSYHSAQVGDVVPAAEWTPTSYLKSTLTFTSPSASVVLDTSLVEVIAVGGAGGAGANANQKGGQGGITIARYKVPYSSTLLVLVGGAGANGQPGPGDGGAGYDPTSLNTGAGGPGYAAYPASPGNLGGTGGGGASGVFSGSVTQGNALVVAGGGGGEGYGPEGPDGGNGGGAVGGAGAGPGTGGGGGGGSNPTSAGGAAGNDQPGQPTPPSPSPIPYAGTALQGGSSPAHFNTDMAYGGGGGGGGYWGGGSGGSSNTTSGANSAAGGGGSGFFASSDVGDIEYHPAPTVERNYQGMGYPGGEQGTGGPYPLGAGKDHPQISPLGTEYGNSNVQGYVIINFYRN